MTKRWNRVLIVLCGMCLLLSMVIPIEAIAVPDSSSVEVKKKRVVSDLVTNHDHGFTEYETTDGKTIFSLDTGTDASKSGDVLRRVDDFDPGIEYILKRGYPNSKILNGGEEDFYITQAALWWYYEDCISSTGEFSDELKNPGSPDCLKLVETFIKPIVERAKSIHDGIDPDSYKYDINNRRRLFDITASTSFEESENKDWIEARLETTDFVDCEIQIDVEDPNIIICDVYGYARSSFSAGDSIVLKYPKRSFLTTQKVSVTAFASHVEPTAVVYRTEGNGDYERMVLLENEPFSRRIALEIEIPGMIYVLDRCLPAIVVVLVTALLFITMINVGKQDAKSREE